LAASDDELSALLRSRKSAVDTVKSRSAIYNLAIRPLASTARKARLLDPWAAADISRDRDGIRWLLEELREDGIEEIEILSKRADGLDQGVDKSRFEALGRCLGRPNLTLRLVMADPQSDCHDRQLRFFYSDGKRNTPVIGLGRGASVFERESYSTPPTVTNDSDNRRAAEERENAILRCLRGKSELQWPPAPPKRGLLGPEVAIRK